MSYYGNYIIENQEIIQEKFSKKKILDYENTLKDINSKKHVFLSFLEKVTWVIGIITAITGYIGTWVVGGVPLGLTVGNFVPIIILFFTNNVASTINEFRRNYNTNKAKELEEALYKLRDTTQKKIEKCNSDKEKKKLQQILDICNKNIAEIERVRKEVEAEFKKQEYINNIKAAKEYIIDLIYWYEKDNKNTWEFSVEDTILGTANYLGLDYKKLGIAYFNNHKKKAKSLEYFLEMLGVKDSDDELNSMFMDEIKSNNLKETDIFVEIGSNDDNIDLLSPEGRWLSLGTNSKIYDMTKHVRFDIIPEKKYFKIADAELGYYLLSEPPKDVKRKEFPIKL